MSKKNKVLEDDTELGFDESADLDELMKALSNIFSGKKPENFGADVTAFVFKDNKQPNDKYVVFGVGYETNNTTETEEELLALPHFKRHTEEIEKEFNFSLTTETRQFKAATPFVVDREGKTSNYIEVAMKLVD